MNRQKTELHENRMIKSEITDRAYYRPELPQKEKELNKTKNKTERGGANPVAEHQSII